MLTDRTEADRLLDAAETLTERVDDYPWGNACRRTPAYVQVQRATCYGRTGGPVPVDVEHPALLAYAVHGRSLGTGIAA